MKQVRKKYRIPRKLKKQQKRELVSLTNKDLLKYGEKPLTSRQIKNNKYSVWIMGGVVYHRYGGFVATNK